MPLTQETNSTVKDRVKIKPPAKYNVIMLNDDFTSMQFVVEVLMKIYYKNNDEAFDIMMQIHQNGSGLAGTYSKDIAETKINLTHKEARQAGFPLRCRLQKV